MLVFLQNYKNKWENDYYLQPIPAAAAAAKSLQSCRTLCDPIDGSPLGSSVHEIFQARVLEWVAIATLSIITHYPFRLFI